jgi:NAD dependent epimerase/dehydratase family enzyme
MRILVTGGTGLIGRAITSRLSMSGHDVVVLSRNPARHTAMGALPRVRVEQADLGRSGPWQRSLDDADVILHLGGDSIMSREHTPARQSELLARHKQVAGEMGRALREMSGRPRAVLLASCVGVYGEGSESVDENAAAGVGFLPELAGVLEGVASHVPEGIPTCRLRFGQVLGPRAPLLAVKEASQLPAADQTPLSWVALDDAVLLVQRLVEQPLGVAVNICAPGRTTVADLHRALGVEPAKSGIFSRLFGKKEASAAPRPPLLTGRVTHPGNALATGFSFRTGSIDKAIAAARSGRHGS